MAHKNINVSADIVTLKEVKGEPVVIGPDDEDGACVIPLKSRKGKIFVSLKGCIINGKDQFFTKEEIYWQIRIANENSTSRLILHEFKTKLDIEEAVKTSFVDFINIKKNLIFDIKFSKDVNLEEPYYLFVLAKTKEQLEKGEAWEIQFVVPIKFKKIVFC